MAKITRTQQRRLVASSIAFILTAAIMMPTATDARGSGGGRSSGGLHVGVQSFTHRHVLTSTPRFPVLQQVLPRHAFSHRRVAFRHGIRSHFFTLGPDSFWVDTFASSPTLVVTQEPAITQKPMASRHLAVVRTPDAPQDGILLVRGNSKAYVTFPGAKPG